MNFTAPRDCFETIGKKYRGVEKYSLVGMTPTSYPSELTASQWAIIQEIIEDGRIRKGSLRLMVNAIFYVVKGGTQWRVLPHDLPPWQTV